MWCADVETSECHGVVKLYPRLVRLGRIRGQSFPTSIQALYSRSPGSNVSWFSYFYFFQHGCENGPKWAKNAPNGRYHAPDFSLKNAKLRLNIITIITCSFMNVFIAFNHLYLSMGRYWNARVLERRFSLINSSHLYSTRASYRATPNYPTKTKTRVPLSLYVALRFF